MKSIKKIALCMCYYSFVSGYSYQNKEDLPQGVVAFYSESNQPVPKKIPAGTLDLTFANGLGYTILPTITGTNANSFNGIAIDQQNRIVTIGSYIANVGGHGSTVIARFLQDGTIDKGFGTNGYVIYNNTVGGDSYGSDVVIDSNNGIVTAQTSGSRFDLARFLVTGDLDDDFNGGHPFVVSTDVPNAMTIDSQGNIILVGTSTNTGVSSFLVSRFNSLGILDTTFNPVNGYFTYKFAGNSFAYSVATDSSDNIIVAGGQGNNLAVIKINYDGSGIAWSYTRAPFDATNFAIAYSVVVDSQGKIVLGGVSNGYFFLLRLTSDGVLDTTFGAGAGYVTYTFGSLGHTTAFQCHEIAIDPLGRIVMMGAQADPDTGNGNFVVARALSDGSLDTTFGGGLGYAYCTLNDDENDVFSGTLDKQGRILLVGTANNSENFALARYTTDYSFDYYKAQFMNNQLGFFG
jgi:uncharacterized delta-60 repeat protein